MMIQKMKIVAALLIVKCYFCSHTILCFAAFGDHTTDKGNSGSRRDRVTRLSHDKRNVFPYHTSTGYYETITENAVTAFQKARNLQVDGIAGSETNKRFKYLDVAILENRLYIFKASSTGGI